MKVSHLLLPCTLLLGVFWFGSLCAFVPASGSEDSKNSQTATAGDKTSERSTTSKRPAWAQTTTALPKPGYKGDRYREEAPAEWEFLGYTLKELHDRYDGMSPCQSEPERFWFHGCGGIDGGGFIEVKCGAAGTVEEAWYCTTGCTYTSGGRHFTDKNEALKYGVSPV